MRVLVTGATGLIGRRLVERLRDEGMSVRALGLPNEDATALGDVDVVRGDVTSPASLTPAVAGVGRVYHLAAVVGDWGPEDLFERVNVQGTRNVLDQAAAAGVDRVVMVSSIVCYGEALSGELCDEETTPREWGVGPYSRTKRASEELALDYHAFGRVPVTIVRPGNVWGPGSGLWVDEVARRLRAGSVPLIDGGRGDACLAYVDNVVDVIVRAGRADQAPGKIYNAADGAGVTWRQYFTDLAGALGVPAPTRSIPGGVAMAAAAALEELWRWRGKAERPLMTRESVILLRSRAVVSIERAKDDLGYHPLVPYVEAMSRVASYLEGQA